MSESFLSAVAGRQEDVEVERRRGIISSSCFQESTTHAAAAPERPQHTSSLARCRHFVARFKQERSTGRLPVYSGPPDAVPLLELPDDLLILILRRLPLDDKVRVGMCCSSLAAATLHPSLWDKIKLNRRITDQHLSNLLTRVGAREHCTSLCFVRPNNRDPPTPRSARAGDQTTDVIGAGLMPLQGSVVLRELDLRENTNRVYDHGAIKHVVKALKKLDHLYITPSLGDDVEAKRVDKLFKIVDRNVAVRRKVCRTCKQSRPRLNPLVPGHGEVTGGVRSCSLCRKWTCEGSLSCGGEPCKSPLLRRCSLCSWCVCSACETRAAVDRITRASNVGFVGCTACGVDFCLHKSCQHHVSQCYGCAEMFCEDCLRFDIEGDGYCDDCQEDLEGEIAWADEDEDDFYSDEQWSDEDDQALYHAMVMQSLQMQAHLALNASRGGPRDEGDEPAIPELMAEVD